jgi:hypothetical protein
VVDGLKAGARVVRAGQVKLLNGQSSIVDEADPLSEPRSKPEPEREPEPDSVLTDSAVGHATL